MASATNGKRFAVSARDRSGGNEDDGRESEARAHPTESPMAERVAEQVCREILALHPETYRHGAGVKVCLLPDLVVVLLEESGRQPNEELLMVEPGHDPAVANIRDQFQQAIGPSFFALAERASGQHVRVHLTRAVPA